MGVFERMDQLSGLTAANPSGVNGYDKGKSFEESTGGVERDHSGRFAPEGGSTRSSRRNRSNKNRADWYGQQKTTTIFDPDKDKKSVAAKKKTDAAAKKAKNDAQRKQLAQLSLEISQASAAGNTLKAAELRVRRAELALSFADTEIEKLNAQTALNNARASLARARRSKRRTSRTLTPPPGQDDVDRAISKYNAENDSTPLRTARSRN